MRARERMVVTVLLVQGLCACGQEPAPAPQQRALLRTEEVQRRKAEERERKRLFDPEGELLPSGEVVAGVELPKGVKLYRELERQYFLQAPGVVLEKLERYFAPRLQPRGVSRTLSSVTFENATVKGAPAGTPTITLRLSRVRGSGPSSDVMLSVSPPPRVYPSEAESQRQLAERRKYAN